MKVLFFDIDGTLLDHSGRMPLSAKRAIKQAKENGHKLILCSGRSKCAVEQLMKRFDFDGCICSAGAYVEYHGQIVNRSLLTKAQTEELIAFLETTEAVYGLQCRDYMACPESSRWAYEKSFPAKESSDDEDGEVLDDIGKTVVFVDDITVVTDVEKAFYYGANVGVIQAGKMLEKDFDVRPASYNMPDGNNGEISLNGVTKSYGMQKLLEYLQVEKDDTIAFGDGYNDLEMLQFVKCGVAMGNAVDELKKVADYVTEAVDHNGLLLAMKHLSLI